MIQISLGLILLILTLYDTDVDVFIAMILMLYDTDIDGSIAVSTDIIAVILMLYDRYRWLYCYDTHAVCEYRSNNLNETGPPPPNNQA